MDRCPSPTYTRSRLPLALLLILLWLPYLSMAQSYYVNYSLPSSGKVSVNIYDEKGAIVRELLHGQSQNAGSYNLLWDGKDGKGNTLANPLQYKWKLLKTPSGLQAEFITGVGSSYPNGANRQWESGLGNHEGTSSVAVDETHAYVAAGGGENVRTQVKLDRSLSQLVFSGWQPDIGQGYFARTILEGKIYGLQADGYVSFHSTSEINRMYQSVGTSANYVGSRWDALYPGKTRPGRGQIAMMQLMDMAGARIATTSHLVISYKEQNLIQWRNPANGAVLDQVTIPAPLGVAIDNAGNVLAISEGKVVRFSRSNKTLVQVIAATALDAPWRLDVDRSTGEILVAEKAGGNQVKKFSSSGSLLKSYGRKTGRAFGLHVATDFYDISDICSDNKGGFYVTEPGKRAIPRVAYINASGSLVKELVGAPPGRLSVRQSRMILR
ncbi:hypothetical protein GXP67_03385 [Rhodocytophaga rosea]|uniref:FlgD/Vpr Ig-like domain-containing protein n=1 Tax=Rhodocytophaga rosea TaxID=2704465 RepID=A0A6C0GCZ4_9BACT|nr:FlgD immunoglobulin-like domain containing protein [Rhodocytophaga rosea]QHT65777.1 hypothetical protein GXP67_03385 [Rhodocytophaga rosea]